MDDVALVGVHGLEGDIAAVLRHLAGDLFRQALEALLALFAVIFCVDLHAGAVLLAAAVDAVVRQLLDGVERFAAAADQRAELFTFEEDLVAALLTLVDLDLSGGVHVLKKALEERADLLALLVVALFAEVDNGLGLRGGTLRALGAGRAVLAAVFARGTVAAFGTRLVVCTGFFFLQHLGRVHGHGLGRRSGFNFLFGLGCGRLFHRLDLFGLAVVIAHANARGRAADAEESGLRALKDFNRNVVSVHLQLRERALDGLVLRLARYVNKLDHSDKLLTIILRSVRGRRNGRGHRGGRRRVRFRSWNFSFLWPWQPAFPHAFP